MEKTVLVPTDFSIASLNIVKNYLNDMDRNAKVNIILLHGMHQNDSITSLLFFSKSKVLASLTNPAFEEALRVLKNKYASQVRIMRKDIFTGFTQAAFNQFVEANRIDEVCLPILYNPQFKNRNSFNLLPYIKASKLNITTVGSAIDVPMPEKGNVAELFANRVSMG